MRPDNTLNYVYDPKQLGSALHRPGIGGGQAERVRETDA